MHRRAGRFEQQLIMLPALSVLSCAQEGPRSSDPPESSGTSASATGDPSGEMRPLDADRWHDIDDGVETRGLDVRRYGGDVEAEDEHAASDWIEVEFARLRVPAE